MAGRRKRGKLSSLDDKLSFIAEVEFCVGNLSEACRNFGVSRQTLYDHMKKEWWFREEVNEVAREVKGKRERAGWFLAQEMVMEGLEAEYAKPEAKRDLKKVAVLTKRFLDFNPNLKKKLPVPTFGQLLKTIEMFDSDDKKSKKPPELQNTYVYTDRNGRKFSTPNYHGALVQFLHQDSDGNAVLTEDSKRTSEYYYKRLDDDPDKTYLD